MDSSDNVYVTDSANNRVEKLTSSRMFITQWGSLGSGPGQFIGPSGVAVDSAGNVYVTDYGNYRVQKFGIAASVSMEQAALIIAIAVIVGSVGAYLIMRNRPKICEDESHKPKFTLITSASRPLTTLRI